MAIYIKCLLTMIVIFIFIYLNAYCRQLLKLKIQKSHLFIVMFMQFMLTVRCFIINYLLNIVNVILFT